jgi:hypothetical protein
MSLSTTRDGKSICARNSGEKFAGVAPVILLIAACPRSSDIPRTSHLPDFAVSIMGRLPVWHAGAFYHSGLNATML